VLLSVKAVCGFLLQHKTVMANTNHVVYAILKFLDEQQLSPDLTPDAIESLEGIIFLNIMKILCVGLSNHFTSYLWKTENKFRFSF